MEIKTLHRPGFEEIVVCSDPVAKLHAIVAIHDTRLGPALGGIRMLPYPSQEEALKDALLLAKAMTYKAAASHLKLGGGKAVVMGDPATQKSKALLRAMGRLVNRFKGRYIAAKDAGVTTADLVEIAQETEHVTGLPESMGGSGDPSPWTALGLLEGIRACLREKLGKKDFAGLRVAVQGMGAVGYALARLLHKEKAELIVSDFDSEILGRAQQELAVTVVSREDIYSVENDLFSPCALGGVLNDRTIPKLRSAIVAGGANNQLLDEAKHDRALFEKGILYAPDYLINAGGLINIYVRDILKEKDSTPWILKIYDHLLEIFALSREKAIGTHQAANLVTERILAGPSVPTR